MGEVESLFEHRRARERAASPPAASLPAGDARPQAWTDECWELLAAGWECRVAGPEFRRIWLDPVRGFWVGQEIALHRHEESKEAGS